MSEVVIQTTPTPGRCTLSQSEGRDPALDHAKEEAEGTELLESPDRDLLLEREREEAQGVEVFEDPDATIPGPALKEGFPGHESLAADAVGLERDEEDTREGGESDVG
jgi:hypothetical protein